MKLTDTFSLANGVAIPKLGLGTWLMADAEAAKATQAAIEQGYRHIDTAQAYGNETGVGQGVRAAGVARDQLFITSKVAAEHKTYESAAASIDESLAKLDLGYIDLLIIHSPQPWQQVNQSEDRFFEGNREAWRALEDAYDAGKVRAIGVSNFLETDLENILDSCRIAPTANQVLAHIGNYPQELADWCAEHKILVEAYSPVAHGALLGVEAVEEIAKRYDASIAQLSIRYVLQKGAVALPKTANPAHMADNAACDFTISDADMASLDALDVTDYGDASFFPVYGGKL